MWYRGRVHEGIHEDFLHELQVADIVPLGLENLEDDGLSLDFVLVKSFEGRLGDKAMPLFIVLVEFSSLEASETLVGVKTTMCIARR